jgi:hypothetical protein
MSDEELIKNLRNVYVENTIRLTAAARIEQLVKERDDAEQREITKIEVNHSRVVGFLTRTKAAEAKLAKAVEALQAASAELLIIGVMGQHKTALRAAEKARDILAELEKTE